MESSAIPPTFESYLLTPLDYLPPPMHMTAYLTFLLKDPAQAVPVLEAAVSQLVSHLPFLTGNVGPSNTSVPGRQNVREVRPSTVKIMKQYPMLSIKHHPQKYISATDQGQVICYDDTFTEEYLPLPLHFATADSSPVYRFQANILEDGIILCCSAHHMAVDGIGQCLVLEALASCCHASDGSLSPQDLLTTPAHEKSTRNQILQASTSIIPQNKGPGSGQTWGTPPPDGSQVPISRKFVLSPDRVSQLKSMCSAHLPQNSISDSNLSRNDLVLGLIWQCVIRARSMLRGPEEPSARSSLSTAIDVRAALRPPLPRTYMGNAVMTIPLISPISNAEMVDAGSSSVVAELLDPTPGASAVGPRTPVDATRLSYLAQIALLIRRGNASVDNEYMRQHLAHIHASPDWSISAASRPAEFGQSSLRTIGTYRLDFGSVLGRVRDFDVPDPRFRSAAWILPARFKDAPWEIRLVLEPEAMALVRQDPLFRWTQGEEGPKL
ncbi:hypothetical protein N7462_006210 [Penicillium macrosclerotiorum]|uniref:uncharacterized protein n=1 Tax=Penicillium macrosclerotiorum TaxID=303699 RepID=UPI002548702C|nr:uncharacterized protein N7462_006210 [Penicillium macrosclerotiorum]KAJ5683045.1 hypothetical protein N7462_006210 [Penicillium macrosclerotiorum]